MAKDSKTQKYVSPLVERNASKEMAELFGAQKKFSTWRRLWLELAKAQKKLGLLGNGERQSNLVHPSDVCHGNFVERELAMENCDQPARPGTDLKIRANFVLLYELAVRTQVTL